MPKFNYCAVDHQGQQITGELDATDNMRAGDRLREMGHFPTSITATKKPTGKAAVRRPTGRVKAKELTAFTRQLATVIEAGLPLLRGLDVMRKQRISPVLDRVLADVAETIESGGTFSEALTQHPKIFSTLYVNMVRAGEAGGMLDVTLLRLAEFQEKSQKIKGKVIAAMVYPCAVIAVAFSVVAFLMAVIVPRFQEIFRDLMEGRSLPWLTLLVISVSNVFRYHGLAFLAVAGGVGVGLHLFARTQKGRYCFDNVKLHAPLLGTLVSKVGIARFTRTLGTLMASGVPILQALNIVRDTVGNAVLAGAINRIHHAVKEGESMTQPLLATHVFPALVISMVEVGEQTGALPDMLTKVADVYDDEVDNAVTALTSLLEPVMIVSLAIIVGTIVIAMFLPLITIVIGLGN